MFGNSVFISTELLNYNCDFRILLTVKIFKTVEKNHHVLGIFCEEHSRVNVLHEQPISFRWFISDRRSKAEMEFSVTAYK